MDRPSVALIAARGADDAAQQLVDKVVVDQQLRMTVVTQDQLVESPSTTLAAQTEPALVLLMPGLPRPLISARALRAHWHHCELIFLCAVGGAEQLRRAFGVAPLIGSHWSIVEVAEPQLSRQIAQALAGHQRRRRLRTTLDRANALLSEPPLPVEGNYQRRLNADHYLHNFIDAARDAIVGLDSALSVLYWSAGAEELFRLRIGEAVQLDAERLPFWSPSLQAGVHQVLAGTASHPHECTCTVDGVDMTLEILPSAVRDGNRQIIGVSLTIRDITTLAAERRASEQRGREMTEERQHLHRLFDQAPGFIAITQGPQHILEIANRAFHQLVGLRDVVGQPALVVFPQTEGRDLGELLDQIYATKRPYVGRANPVLVSRTGSAGAQRRFVDFIFQPILTEQDEVSGIFCQGHDVTQQILAQQALQQSQDNLLELVNERTRELEQSRHALYQSQKLEAIGKLTGGVAHDFNNVLQVIAGNLQLMRPMLASAQLGSERLDAAAQAVERGAKLAAELLAFARRQPLRPTPTNLSRLLRNMDELLRQALGERVEIETIVAGGLWTTMVDPNQLENVLLNLAINARDAMSEGGKLTLELCNAMLDEHYAQTQVDVEPGQYVLLAVSDTGVGMTEQTIERAFEPFYTTKAEGEGTGLGLSMAYGFAKQSGGHIRIYSELGSGTTVKLYLPRTEQPEVTAVPLPVGPAVGGNETILVVEDDLAVQATVIELLSGLGYRVLRANDAQSALSILHSGMVIDLLFTDVVMPGKLSSTELARQAKLLLPNIAVLFTSGYTRNAIVHGGKLDAGVELLSKPYRQEDLARKIRQLLGQRDLTQAPDDVGTQPMRRYAMVVEDQPQLLELTCEMLEELGFAAVGFHSAEEASQALDERHFDCLLVDVNLPGMSGPEFAALALQAHPRLRVVFVSGDGVIETELQARSLPKPYSFEQLEAILSD
ncbi:histidine kinase [Stutzerimonas stutzeri]|uniref:histidine kinase n=2 Tax=Stutzerimonas stutzeri TaxID=316 RepID=W8QT46_STUST|nr:histidine kinase [Stutzerimonas stutzeri]